MKVGKRAVWMMLDSCVQLTSITFTCLVRSAAVLLLSAIFTGRIEKYESSADSKDGDDIVQA